MFILNQKLKNLKHKLKFWNKNVFGNINTLVKEAEQKLISIQTDIDINGASEALLENQKSAQIDFEKALNKEEEFWKEKSNSNWHSNGDRNTRYFHRLTKIKQTSKLINSINDGENVLTEPDQISSHITNHFQNIFSSNFVVQDLQVEELIDGVIPNLISEDTNHMLTMLPSPDEIFNAVNSLKKDSAPSPNVFGAIFYQTYWPIVKHDVINVVLEFFSKDWLLPNFNSNTIVLIPKVPDAMSVSQYRPITLANFKFKIVSKILADRLAPIMNNIISPQQRGFIQGRNIRDCICVTSEAINHLHNKAFAGNLAFKVDISKAFDTLEWQFLLKVLNAFGFNNRFCSWIDTILNSAMLSINVNGKLNGFFKCKRGVRQGDPLSPLLFCIAEDVLSRNISKLVDLGKLEHIKGTRHIQIPSHALYADDIMIFCKGKISSVNALMDLFKTYVLASGQIINPSKSTVYYGSISVSRINRITNLIGFNKGSLPFFYLGVPIFKGKPKKSFLQPIADKIKSKLSSWKASLLSIAGTVVLVKSIIQGMLIHSISIYSWPQALLKDIECWVRNFIWSGDVSKRKMVTISWNKICKPYLEGGLGLRSLTTLNEAANLKLCWDLKNSKEDWAVLLRSKVFRGNKVIAYHIFSSIWSSVKVEFKITEENCTWIIGNGESINFWLDTWYKEPLVSILNIPKHLHANLTDKVSDFMLHSQWNIPTTVLEVFPTLSHFVQQTTLPSVSKDDNLVWKGNSNGFLSFKDAFLFKYGIRQNISWAKSVWSPDIPPSLSLLIWRLMHNKMPTDDNLMLRGSSLPSMCSSCQSCVETTTHLFFHCSFALKLWSWLAGILNKSM